MSSGIKHALGEAASWLLVAAIGIATIIYFDDLKALTRQALGMPTPPMEVVANQAPLNNRPRRTSSSGAVEIRASKHGQYVTFANINGHEAKVLVDTGASAVALTSDDAEAAGIFPNPSDFTVKIMTANGIGKAAPVVLESLSVGDITVHDVRALVNEPGTLSITLLGMTFLNRLSKVDIGQGRMLLEQ